MTWGDWFLSAMSIGYFGASAAYFAQGNTGYAVALTCYGIANFGLIYAAK